MHLASVAFHPDQYPTDEQYPFHLAIFRQTERLDFRSPVVLFVGENGTGKSTLLEAVARRCGIHIWEDSERPRFRPNPYEKAFYRYLSIQWCDGIVPGSFFGSATFRDFARMLDEWAAADPRQLEYFGGSSLLTQSHGQSIMSFLRARCAIKGLYLMDEPETALSPKTQFALLEVLSQMSAAGHAQFVIATHSPILLACPQATIFSFDHVPIRSLEYEETDHYKIYRSFMEDRHRHLKGG